METSLHGSSITLRIENNHGVFDVTHSFSLIITSYHHELTDRPENTHIHVHVVTLFLVIYI